MTKINRFKSSFKAHVSEDDRITAHVNINGQVYDVSAMIERDDTSGAPDENDEGFWPSLDPLAAGFIGEDKTPEDLNKETRKAKSIMRAWKNDDWFYCGVIIRVALNDEIVDVHAKSLWGIECNFPNSNNEYLTDVANELLEEWIAEQTEGAK